MERTDLVEAKSILGNDFIGPKELENVFQKLGKTLDLVFSEPLPEIPFTADFLKEKASEYVLILGLPSVLKKQPLTINCLVSFFGKDPSVSEPCFYNQDWYNKEAFAQEVTPEFKWYLLRKKLRDETRSLPPSQIEQNTTYACFPPAVVCCYAFFVYYYHSNKEVLWKNDFVWCSDYDHNGDRIYVGRYYDPDKINKNGFNIHRHLSFRKCYGAIDFFSN